MIFEFLYASILNLYTKSIIFSHFLGNLSVDRFEISELSELEGLTDDEDADLSWHLSPHPRIELFSELIDEDGSRPTINDGEDEPSSSSDNDEEEPQPTAEVNGSEPRPNVDPNPDTLNSGDWELCGWKLQEDFDPLPLSTTS